MDDDTSSIVGAVPMTRGKFIAIEGIDGVGKTKQCELLGLAFGHAKVPFTLTNEPNGLIRMVLLNAEWSGMEELWLLMAGRSRHIHQTIEPRLADGRWVICDRFSITTLAYQGGGRRIPLPVVARINETATGGRVPDLAIVLDAPVNVARERLVASGKTLDRMESLGDDFYERARNVFLSEVGPGVVLIDATLSVKEVHRKVIEVVSTVTGVELESVA